MLRVFVYGTLKHSYWNHDKYMSGSTAMEPATILGRLHIRHTGTPILEIPAENILARGSQHYNADAETQRRFSGQAPDLTPGDKWVRVHGELYTYNDPETRLPKLDELEEYFPGRESLYDRVLTWCGRRPESRLQRLGEQNGYAYIRENSTPEATSASIVGVRISPVLFAAGL